jgi:hypothetical protein
MESRKKQNLEIERQKKSKQRTFTAVLTIAIIAAVGLLGFAVWDNINRRTIMTFEGENIATSDFRFFNAMQQPSPDSRYNALDGLLRTLTLLNQAEAHNLRVTPEQQAELMSDAAMLREQANWQQPGMLNFITDNRIAQINSIEFFLDSLIDIYITQDFEIDEDEFAEALEEHRENVVPWLADMQIKYAASLDPAEIATTFMGEDEDISAFEPVDFIEFTQDIGISLENWQHFQNIVNLEVGEVLQLVEMNGVFYNILMYERVLEDESIEEAEASFRENFTNEAREDAFFELLESWVANANYSLNNRAFNRF